MSDIFLLFYQPRESAISKKGYVPLKNNNLELRRKKKQLNLKKKEKKIIHEQTAYFFSFNKLNKNLKNKNKPWPPMCRNHRHFSPKKAERWQAFRDN